MTESADNEPVLIVVFFKSASGSEPVREWLLSLVPDARRVIGYDIKTAQYGWPLGMPLIRKLEPDLWEVRSDIAGGHRARDVHRGRRAHGTAARVREEVAEDAGGGPEDGTAAAR